MELAALYVEKQDCARAIETYRTATTLFPKYLSAHWGLAESYIWCGQREAALETYRKLEELSPGNIVTSGGCWMLTSAREIWTPL